MHPAFFPFIFGCALWFSYCARSAGKSRLTSVGFALLGIVAFFVSSILMQVTIGSTGFFRRAVAAGSDLPAILMYLTVPATILTFALGLILKRSLTSDR